MAAPQSITPCEQIFNLWKGQTKDPKIDLSIFTLKVIGWSALSVWTIRRVPISSRQVLLVSISAATVSYILEKGCKIEEMVEQTGLYIEPGLAMLMIAGGYGLYRVGSSLLPSCLRSFRWMTLLDTAYHGVVGAAALVAGGVNTVRIWKEGYQGKGIFLADHKAS